MPAGLEQHTCRRARPLPSLFELLKGAKIATGKTAARGRSKSCVEAEEEEEDPNSQGAKYQNGAAAAAGGGGGGVEGVVRRTTPLIWYG